MSIGVMMASWESVAKTPEAAAARGWCPGCNHETAGMKSSQSRPLPVCLAAVTHLIRTESLLGGFVQGKVGCMGRHACCEHGAYTCKQLRAD